MKIAHVSGLALFGMFAIGGAVYAVTPAGGFGAITPNPEVAETSTTEDEEAPDGPDTQRSLAEFSVGSTLKIDGRVGHPTMLEGEKGETFLLLEATGTSTGEGSQQPSSLSLVIDKSGSMSGSRIQNALNAATTAVDRLKDGDSVTVVAFDTKAEIITPLTVVSPSTRGSILSAIRGIKLGGDTCVSCGVEEGLSQLQRNSENVRRMIVLSDGDANSGVRDVPGFRSMGERSQRQGVSVTTIGVDVDFNEKLLSALSQSSNGRHYFVENDIALTRVFDEEAKRLVESVASNVTAEIELPAGVELVQVFDRSFTRAGSRVSVPLGSFAKGEQKTILVKLRAPTSADGDLALANIKFAYNDLVAKKDATSTGSLGTTITKDKSKVSEIDGVVLNRLQRSETAASLREANTLFSLGKFDEAKRRLDLQRESVNKAKVQAKTAAPASRAKDIDNDFERQGAALDNANPFASPPTGGVQATTPASPSDRAGKAGVKRNEQNASEFGF